MDRANPEQHCEVDVFEGYDPCQLDAMVRYVPRGNPDKAVPLCVEHAKQLSKRQYDDSDGR